MSNEHLQQIFADHKIMRDLVSIWVILKSESCWAALILYRIENNTQTANPSLYRYLFAEPYFIVSFLSLRSTYDNDANMAT